MASSYVNITRYIPLYTYTTRADPWMEHWSQIDRNRTVCEAQCNALPHCTGFESGFKGHCHLFYIPFCLGEYAATGDAPVNTAILAKSDPAAEWRPAQKVAVLPATRPVGDLASMATARLVMTGQKSATLSMQATGSRSWTNDAGLSCDELCTNAPRLFDFDCALAVDERGDQWATKQCTLFDRNSAPTRFESSRTVDTFVNTQAIASVDGCRPDRDEDERAARLSEQPSALDSEYRVAERPNSAPRRTLRRPLLLLSGALMYALAALA